MLKKISILNSFFLPPVQVRDCMGKYSYILFFLLIAKGLNVISESRLAHLRAVLVKGSLVSLHADSRDLSLTVFSLLYEIVFSFSSI